MARSFKQVDFSGSSVDSETITFSPVGTQGTFAVYAKKLTGTVSLKVFGSYVSDASSANDRVQITGSTSINTTLTLVTAVTNQPYPYLYIEFTPTGDSSVEVYVAQL